MKRLLFISIALCCLFGGCTIKAYRNFEIKKEGNSELSSLFHDMEVQSYLFKTVVNFRQERFTGLLLVKRMEEKVFRVVFTTEVGLKIFDVEVNPETTKVHYVLEEINRDKFIDLIENDLSLLLMNDVSGVDMNVFADEHKAYTLYAGKKERVYYLLENTKNMIIRMEKSNLIGKSLISIELENYQFSFPEKISITHGRVPLDLQLRFIRR